MELTMNTRKIILRVMIAVLTFSIGVSTYLVGSGELLSDISDQWSAAPSAIEQNCDIFAGIPQFSQADRIIFGSGARGPACTSSAGITVYLKQDRRFWFDRTLASKSGVGTNFEVFARYNCRGAGGQIVYIEVRSGGRKVQSRRVGVAFCG
jgi:hypothetical protein